MFSFIATTITHYELFVYTTQICVMWHNKGRSFKEKPVPNYSDKNCVVITKGYRHNLYIIHNKLVTLLIHDNKVSKYIL